MVNDVMKNNFGFVRVGAAVPMVKVANVTHNLAQIKTLLKSAEKECVEVVVFPELALTGATCGDLFFQQTLLESAQRALAELLEFSATINVVGVLGMPLLFNGRLYNVAVVFHKGKICGVVPKYSTHNVSEGDEQRRFCQGNAIAEDSEMNLCNQQVKIATDLLFETPTMRFAVDFGSDLYAVTPRRRHVLNGAEVVFNLSALAATTDVDTLELRLRYQALQCVSGYVSASAGFGESSTDMVFSGQTFIFENEQLLASTSGFALDNQLSFAEIDVERIRNVRRRNYAFCNAATSCRATKTAVVFINSSKPSLNGISRKIDAHPFIPSDTETLNSKCAKAYAIQLHGLLTRLAHTSIQKAVIGISGGLDSTWALLVTIGAFDKLGIDRKNIIAITMPGFGTSDRTHSNAEQLIREMGVTFREISITKACLQHFEDIAHDADSHDTTYENAQARERTQILMDVANKENALVIGTGDMSELALGWATYNGDHMSMYGVNAGITKTLIPYLIKWYVKNEPITASVTTILFDIINTPISPELLPATNNGNIAQKTEDLVGPYELHDFFLYHFLNNGSSPQKIQFLAEQAFSGVFEKKEIEKWLKNFFRRFFAQQFKRSCLPDGPKVESVSLSPRGGLLMPSDASNNEWLNVFSNKNNE